MSCSSAPRFSIAPAADCPQTTLVKSNTQLLTTSRERQPPLKNQLQAKQGKRTKRKTVVSSNTFTAPENWSWLFCLANSLTVFGLQCVMGNSLQNCHHTKDSLPRLLTLLCAVAITNHLSIPFSVTSVRSFSLFLSNLLKFIAFNAVGCVAHAELRALVTTMSRSGMGCR